MLPSPEDLKKKILIKAKRLPPGKTEEEDLDESEDEEDERDDKKKTKIKVRETRGSFQHMPFHHGRFRHIDILPHRSCGDAFVQIGPHLVNSWLS